MRKDKRVEKSKAWGKFDLYIIHESLSFVILLLCISPYWRFIPKAIYILSAALWCILGLTLDKENILLTFIGKNGKNLIIYIWILFLAIMAALDHAVFPFRIIMITFVMQMYWYYSEKASALYRQIWVLLLYIIFVCANSIIQLSSDPTISRKLAGASFEKASLFMAGYGFVYGMAFLVPVLVNVFFTSSRILKWRKFLLVLAFGLAIPLLVMAQYMIAITLCVITFFLMAVFHKRRSKRFYAILLLIVFILIFALQAFAPMLVRELNGLLINHPKLGTVWVKLKNILGIITFESAADTGTASDRMMYYKISWNTFALNPVIGIGNTAVSNMRIGNHSRLIDTLGEFGVLGFLCFIVSYGSNAIKHLRLSKRREIIWIVYSVYVAFLLVNTGMEMGDSVVLFYLIPALLTYSSEKREAISIKEDHKI